MIEKALDRSLKEWGRKKLSLALKRRDAKLKLRYARLRLFGYTTEAKIEERLSYALLVGLNPNLEKYLYKEEVKDVVDNR